MEDHAENLGEEAVSGIRNIERWRKDIKDLAELILSNINIKSFFTEKKLQGWNLSANSSTDIASSGRTNLNSWSFNLYCTKEKGLELSIKYFSGMHLASISLKETNIPAGVVQSMREKLSVLVEISVETFPELEEKLQPFLKAGKINIFEGESKTVKVKNLLHGLSENDRKKKEIEQILGMLHTLITSQISGDSNSEIKFEFKSEKGRWVVFREKPNQGVFIACYPKVMVRKNSAFTMTDNGDFDFSGPEDNASTYELLQLLIDGALETWPSLKEWFEPFIKVIR